MRVKLESDYVRFGYNIKQNPCNAEKKSFNGNMIKLEIKTNI